MHCSSRHIDCSPRYIHCSSRHKKISTCMELSSRPHTSLCLLPLTPSLQTPHPHSLVGVQSTLPSAYDLRYGRDIGCQPEGGGPLWLGNSSPGGVGHSLHGKGLAVGGCNASCFSRVFSKLYEFYIPGYFCVSSTPD